MGSKIFAAIFSNAEGGTSDTVHDEESGPTARVAGNRVWRVAGLLV